MTKVTDFHVTSYSFRVIRALTLPSLIKGNLSQGNFEL